MKSGVYLLYNTENGMGYVGCTKNLNRRKQEHFVLLDKGEHHNPYLQHAYNKYGRDAFAYCVLEYCVESDLYKTEQKWIDKFISEERAYNINPKAQEPPHTEENLLKASITRRGDNPITLLDENEVPYTFQNIAAFCRENGLSSAFMHRLLKGNTLQYRGWHLPGKTLQEIQKEVSNQWSIYNGGGKPVILVSPDGKEYVTTNITWFAKEHGLRQSSLQRVVKKQRYHYKGWHLKGADLSKAMRLPGTTHVLISPSGEKVTFSNQMQFAREHGIHFKYVNNLIRGKLKCHQGWHLPETPTESKILVGQPCQT